MLAPVTEFWRLWARAFAVIALGLLALAAARPAHAALWKTSFYGAESGTHNADGSRFEPMGFTAANWALPFGTRLKVCFRGCVVVTVRDRGPARYTGRALDLARGAARAIGLEKVGVGMVDVEVIRQGAHAHPRSARRGSRSGPRHAASRRLRFRHHHH